MGMTRLLVLAAIVAWSALVPATPATAQVVTGAGSTLAQPLLARWSQAYLRSQRDAEYQPVAAGLDYEPIGSQAGMMRVRERGVDFGATEQPLSGEEIARYGVIQFPIAVGGIVAAVNLEGVEASQLRLTGELLADIYGGKVSAWNDPAIAALNPQLRLPAAPITTVHRSDGSGTTAIVTAYLSQHSSTWRKAVGEGLTVAWPTGMAAKGNEGVAEAVRRTPNAIGYMDYASARRAGLAAAGLRNRDGQFVAPGPASFQAAAAAADWSSARDFVVRLVDVPGEAAYPLVATTYAIMPREGGAAAGRRAALAFFSWALDHGGGVAAELGYVPLPASVAAQVRAYWPTVLSDAR
ncbi:phosphate-binding protein PstS [Chelatococcus reniformis]|uniref:Phosphate-binding protein PstS n=2 Tax=Chelatococcus reniformis TaxID=1494448 RepID=A0A916TXJ3_9HYPH|nr:phosphate-binding protein PstS [Chelatococcus reniformis]